LSVELPEFTAVQVQDLATRHGLDWGMEEVERLMKLTNGHPYLVQVALHHISSETIALDELLETATYEDSIYSRPLAKVDFRPPNPPILGGT
jgi:hypothetical protein